MIHIKSVLERVPPLGAAVTLLLASTIPAIAISRRANAAPLTDRSLTVTSTVANDDLLAPDGTTYTVGSNPGELAPKDPRNGQQVGHTYTFTAATTQDLEGFTIEYCETAFGFVGVGACSATATTGLLGTDGTNGFNASSWDGATVTVTNTSTTATQVFTIDASDAVNFLTLTSSTPLTVAADDVITIDFVPVTTDTNHFVNPRASYKGVSNGTYFAHIETFATEANATAAFAATDPDEVDDGTVTNNITTAIGIYTRVQETLNFSVEGDGGEGDTDPGSPTAKGIGCSPLTEPGQLTMGDTNDALSTQQAYDARSYFRLATNSSNGVSVMYSGDTLKTKGASPLAIDAMATKSYSSFGTEQFGLAIDSAAPDVDISGLTIPSDYIDGDGTISDVTPANNAQFTFNTGSVTTPEPIATAPGVVDCKTGAVRYVANIAPDTPAGIYQTKINYIASPSY